ncbi:MAG TPA: FKBP-type peptidyl-prolyl cis-trans isomerase [Nitrospiraceae bacterium]|nr:FKBP-type peptidyl-prolyl cis-trans isomerase [Nitrospiraceae bacterium]
MKTLLAASFAAVLVISPSLASRLSAQTASEPISEGANVTLEMTITVPDDHLVIPNHKSQYTHGSRQLIPGLEEALAGMRAGERKHVELDASRAFGPYDAAKKVSVERAQLPEKIKVGDITTTAEGQPFTVVALSDNKAVIDFNHPLAGKNIVLDVHVLNVKPKT